MKIASYDELTASQACEKELRWKTLTPEQPLYHPYLEPAFEVERIWAIWCRCHKGQWLDCHTVASPGTSFTAMHCDATLQLQSDAGRPQAELLSWPINTTFGTVHVANEATAWQKAIFSRVEKESIVLLWRWLYSDERTYRNTSLRSRNTKVQRNGW